MNIIKQDVVPWLFKAEVIRIQQRSLFRQSFYKYHRNKHADKAGIQVWSRRSYLATAVPDAYRLKAIQNPQGKSRGRWCCRHQSPDKTSRTPARQQWRGFLLQRGTFKAVTSDPCLIHQFWPVPIQAYEAKRNTKEFRTYFCWIEG